MCADGKQSYREQGYKPRDVEQLWDESAMNPKNKKKQSTGTEFLERYVR
jgi:hypothetical protein